MEAGPLIKEVKTLQEAALLCMNATTVPMQNDTAENRALATFMTATHWMLVQLTAAALEHKLLPRLVQMQDEWTAALVHLQSAKSGAPQ